MAKRKLKAQAFRGFSPAAFRFLAELAENNERAWFAENKGRYEALWKEPLEAFLEDAEPSFGAGKVFRVHRDVRFSKDKRPYKTHASVVMEAKGIVHYLHLEADHAFVATGIHDMAKDQCKRLREGVDDGRTGPALVRIVDRLEAAGFEIGGEALKTAPRGYAKDHPRVRFLRHKGLTASKTWRWKKRPPAWIVQSDALERIAETWAEARKMNAWLAEQVGPSEEGTRWVQ
ncbi:MAG: DUF2461 domain-containing protein [Myxococcota bacterium]